MTSQLTTNMYAYQLLARCKYLTLCGQDEDGDLEWVGTLAHWKEVSDFERHSEELIEN